MKAYRGSFIKKDGTIRKMYFAKLEDIPNSFLEKNILGTSTTRKLPKGMETVWDLEEDAFRTFNWAAVLDHPQEINLKDDWFE